MVTAKAILCVHLIMCLVSLVLGQFWPSDVWESNVSCEDILNLDTSCLDDNNCAFNYFLQCQCFPKKYLEDTITQYNQTDVCLLLKYSVALPSCCESIQRRTVTTRTSKSRDLLLGDKNAHVSLKSDFDEKVMHTVSSLKNKRKKVDIDIANIHVNEHGNKKSSISKKISALKELLSLIKQKYKLKQHVISQHSGQINGEWTYTVSKRTKLSKLLRSNPLKTDGIEAQEDSFI